MSVVHYIKNNDSILYNQCSRFIGHFCMSKFTTLKTRIYKCFLFSLSMKQN